MKFLTFAAAAAALAFASPALAQTTSQTVSYDNTYDDASLSLSSVACSDGIYGLETKGYTTLGSLPKFPYVGGAYTVGGWNSPSCGTCYSLTWSVTGNTIYVLAVDVSVNGFNIAEEAMNTLTNGQAYSLGRITADTAQVDVSYCGL